MRLPRDAPHEGSATLQEIVGERIMLVRKRRKLSQPELAHQAKMGTTTLNRVEKAHNSMSIDKLVAIAQVLRCSTDYLLGLSEEEPGERRPTATNPA